MLKRIFIESTQRNGKFSPTLLTMAVASWSFILYGWADFFKSGYNSEVFWGFLAVGTGIKITDAVSKKLKPTME